MLQLSQSLEGPENWDTNWARKFLKIPQDQLNKLENITDWRNNQILTTKNTVGNEVHIITTENGCLLQSDFVFEKFSQSNSTTKNIDYPKVSNLLSSTKNKPINFSITENRLIRSASLNFLNLCDKFLDHVKLRSTNSVPNIKELILSNSDLTSVEHRTISSTDPQKSKTSKLSKFNPSEKKLNKTFIVATKFNKMESFSQPEMNYKRFPPSMMQLPLEKLADKILNHRYLKGSVDSTKKSDDTELFEVSMLEGSKQISCDLSSPSKECVSPTKETSKQENNFVNTKSLELLKPIFQAPKDPELQVQGKLPNAVSSPIDMRNEDYVQEGTPAVQNSVQESGVNDSRDKKEDASNYEHNPSVTPTEPTKNEESNALSDNNETFGSQLIPCGQPMPAEGNPCSQPNVWKKANIKTQDKADDVTNIAASTGNSGGNVTAQNPSHAAVRSSGTKRKRKSKVETPKRIKEAEHSIHFTADQVRNMLEMIKMLHSET